MNLFSSFLTPLKRFRVVFSCLWGEHVFVHVLRQLQGGFEEKLKGGFKGSFRGSLKGVKGGLRGGFKG